MLEGRQRGWALAALGMLLVSTDSYFVRLADIDGWSMAFMVSCLSLPLQLVLQRFLEGGDVVGKFRASPRGLATVGLLSGVSQICFIIAITRTDVANVVVIVASSPIIAAVVGRIFFGERTNRRTWIAIGITVCGVLIVVSSSIGSPNLVGDLLALAAVSAFAINMNVWRRYKTQSRFVGLSIAASVTIVISVWFADPFGHSATVYLAVIGMGLIFNPLGRLCHTSAPRHAPASEVALFTPVETLAASAWAWIAFSEQPTAQTFLGGFVIFLGLLYGTAGRREPVAVAG
ncbi:MAG: EamA family transporter [Actinomycetota bacterium]